MPCVSSSVAIAEARRRTSSRSRAVALRRETASTVLRSSSADGGGDVDSGGSRDGYLDVPSLQHSFYALRHGRSLANEEGIVCSNPEIAVEQFGLSFEGAQQATQIAGGQVLEAFRRDGPYDALCLLSSDFLRARQTAEHVKDVLEAAVRSGLLQRNPLYCGDVILLKRLRERWFGDFDMKSDQNYEKVWEQDAVDPCHTENGVESAASVAQRASACVRDWDRKLSEEFGSDARLMVVCVAHGDVLQMLQTCFEQVDVSRHRELPHLETAQLRALHVPKTT